MKKNKYRIAVFLIVFVWFGLAFVAWFKPENLFSTSERRKLATFPKPQKEAVLKGNYINQFETYSLDQFPLRDSFRTMKAITETSVLRKKDNHEIYVADGYAVKMEYPLNTSMVESAMEKFAVLYETYGKEKVANTYFAVVPDKGYFIGDQTGHLTFHYQELFDMVEKGAPYAQYINLTSLLEVSDYYKTDSHWKQNKIVDVAEKLAKEMDVTLTGEYEEKSISKPFYGVYYGQSALPLKADKIEYLTNDILEQCKVYNVETNETSKLFNKEKLDSRDLYDVYLSGAASILYIDNPNAKTEKELVVFRDSFASSLIPLLAEGYSKITLVDTRYIQPSMIGDYVDFEEVDLLFLYSTTILNNSQSLR